MLCKIFYFRPIYTLYSIQKYNLNNKKLHIVFCTIKSLHVEKFDPSQPMLDLCILQLSMREMSNSIHVQLEVEMSSFLNKKKNYS